MEPVPPVGREVMRVLGGAVCVAALLGAACLPHKQSLRPGHPGPAPEGKPGQLAATWSNKVAVAPDTVHGGTPVPGLVGRAYLFGPDGVPTVGDGQLTVDLYDSTPREGAHEPTMLERWIIDPETLKKFVKRDRFGEGYTLFLPWGTYRPEITRVYMTVRLDPAAGTPLVAPGETVTLDHSDVPPEAKAAKPPVAAGAPLPVPAPGPAPGALPDPTAPVPLPLPTPAPAER